MDMKKITIMFFVSIIWITTSLMASCTGVSVSTIDQSVPGGERPLGDNFEAVKRIRNEHEQRSGSGGSAIRIAVGPIVVKANSSDTDKSNIDISIHVNQTVSANSGDGKTDDGYRSKYHVNEVARSQVIMDLSNDVRVEVIIPSESTQKAIMKGRYDTQALSEQDIDYLIDGVISNRNSGGFENYIIYLRLWDTDRSVAAASAKGNGDTIDKATHAAIENLLENHRRKSNNAG